MFFFIEFEFLDNYHIPRYFNIWKNQIEFRILENYLKVVQGGRKSLQVKITISIINCENLHSVNKYFYSDYELRTAIHYTSLS